MKTLIKTFWAAMLGVAFFACEPLGTDTIEPTLTSTDNVNSSASDLILSAAYCGTPQLETLWTEEDNNAGTVTFYNDETNLYVNVFATGGFFPVSQNIKMWVGTDLTLLPQNLYGIPSPGLFPYKVTVTGTNEYTFTIPLANIAGYNTEVCGSQNIYAVVHVDLYLTTVETAFAGSIKVDGSRPWYYAIYTPRCCETPPPPSEGSSETAFAKFDKMGGFGTGYVFTTNSKSNPEGYASLGLTQNRWGWAGNFTADGTYTFDVWAGAGLNNTANGTKVGTLTVVKAGTSVTVTYNMTGFSLQEVHIYAGDFMPATIAPGQYGHTESFGDSPADYPMTYTASFTIADTNSDGVWIIAHAVAFGPF